MALNAPISVPGITCLFASTAMIVAAVRIGPSGTSSRRNSATCSISVAAPSGTSTGVVVKTAMAGRSQTTCRDGWRGAGVIVQYASTAPAAATGTPSEM